MAQIQTKYNSDATYEYALNLSQKKSSIFSSIGFGPNKSDIAEDSAKYFLRAASLYKLENNWEKAGLALVNYAEQCKIINECNPMPTMASIDEINAYIEAANCFAKIDEYTVVCKAIELFSKAINIYTENGNFDNAGKLHKRIANLYTKQNMCLEALSALENAIKLFEINSKYMAELRESQIQYATMLSKTNVDMYCNHRITNNEFISNLQKSAEIFEKIARNMCENKLGYYNAKTYFCNSLICLLAVDLSATDDLIKTKIKLDEFNKFDYTFSNSKEYEFIDGLIKSLENQDIMTFSNVCYLYDQINNFNSWHLTMLSHIKKSIEKLSNRFNDEFDDKFDDEFDDKFDDEFDDTNEIDLS
jgi:hypothetical protein